MYGIISPPLALGGEGVEVRPVRVRPFLAPTRGPVAPVSHPSCSSSSSRIPYPRLPRVPVTLSSYLPGTRLPRLLCVLRTVTAPPFFTPAFVLYSSASSDRTTVAPYCLSFTLWPIHAHIHIPFLPLSLPCNLAAAECRRCDLLFSATPARPRLHLPPRARRRVPSGAFLPSRLLPSRPLSAVLRTPFSTVRRPSVFGCVISPTHQPAATQLNIMYFPTSCSPAGLLNSSCSAVGSDHEGFR